jgi:anti-anti-sigma factor
MSNERKDGYFELPLEGRLDASQASRVETELDSAIRNGATEVRINLAKVVFVSSAGIRVLLKTYQILKKLGGSFGVLQPSESVRNVLALSGLLDMLQVAPQPAEAVPVTTTGPEPDARTFGPVQGTVYREAPGASWSCRLIGDPAPLDHAAFSAPDMTTIQLTKDTLALGLGSLGAGYEDCRMRFGEFLAAGHVAACLPSGGDRTPDYIISKGSLVPEVRVLYALLCEGGFSCQYRFDTNKQEGPAPLSTLIQAGLEIVGAPTIGWAMIAESAGLIGAALKRSPASGRREQSIFEYPGVREWMMHTSEREFHHAYVLAVGVSSASKDHRLAAFLRPIGAEGQPLSHQHAAIFQFRALPRGKVDFHAAVNTLFEDGRLTGLLHLLSDVRPLVGAGESLFSRGTLWLSPISSIARHGVGA